MIGLSDFFAKMDHFTGANSLPKRVAVAVSGGADSLCLCLLAFLWAKEKGVKLFALTVDHRLRPESADEADFVHNVLTEKGIEHTTLVWQGEKPKTRIEEKAREERYRLLLDWCKKKNVPVLLIAHHQDDQAETFFQRLIHSSGVDGLSGIQAKTVRDGIQLWRPLLDFSRKDIQETMKKYFHQKWVEDPSNQSVEYERVRLRKFQNQLDKVGLSTEAVALSARRLSRARHALEQMTLDFWTTHVLCHDAGFIFIDKRDFAPLPEEIALRILNKALTYVSGAEARMSQLETLYPQLAKNVCTTLCECVIISNKQGIYVCKEFSRMPKALNVNKDKVCSWAGFEVYCNQDVKVAPLGDALKIKNLPAAVQRVIPAFFDKKGLAFVPALDYKRENTDIIGTIQKKE